MRFFVRIAYRGTHFSGWQSQQSDVTTIQETIEKALHTISGSTLPIIGCGRTDSGVHAKKFYFHFDSELEWTDRIYSLNSLCGYDIAIQNIFKVDEGAHARFDATRRDYNYLLHTYKDPFLRGLSYYFKEEFDLDRCNEAAELLLEYSDFTTFCKTNTDVTHKKCELFISEWKEVEPGKYIYHISANRFLRGMVRLIVGMCLNIGKGRLSLEEVRSALNQKLTLDRAWSVPAHGLYLTDVQYPYLND
ncbi:MAG: tRNA pseudouridine(38-40) synthase TruA [Saprospiraceae bacterium]|nr:tRNA pseudouridine(38-40) synthase TruA [Saprospiraceae bacterium]